MKRDVKLQRCNYETIADEAWYTHNYTQSPHYSCLKTLIVGDDVYALVGVKAYKVISSTAQKLLDGSAQGTVFLNSDMGNTSDTDYMLNLTSGKIELDRTESEPPTWSRHYTPPDPRYM